MRFAPRVLVGLHFVFWFDALTSTQTRPEPALSSSLPASDDSLLSISCRLCLQSLATLVLLLLNGSTPNKKTAPRSSATLHGRCCLVLADLARRAARCFLPLRILTAGVDKETLGNMCVVYLVSRCARPAMLLGACAACRFAFAFAKHLSSMPFVCRASTPLLFSSLELPHGSPATH